MMKQLLNRYLVWQFWAFAGSLVLLLIGFSLFVVKDLVHPLSGGGDTDYWEYTGFYLSQNLKFSPLPQLNLINDQAFYPYGVNQVFQPWGLERDYLYAVLSHLFGLGPWVQIYYLTSIAIAFLGSFLLLRRDYGFGRALGFGLIVTVGSFYTIGKYPGHVGYAVVHWTILNLICDFLLIRRYVLRQPISLQLILLRALLLVLALGQELGYVAGFALTSVTLSGLWIAVCGLIDFIRHLIQRRRIKPTLKKQYDNWRNELIQHPRTIGILVLLIFITAYLYVPLIGQISQAARSLKFEAVASWAWSPIRLLIPILPGIEPWQYFWRQRLGDVAEGWTDGSPGYFLLILGAVGLLQARKLWPIFVPLFLLLVACVFYEPLKIFPWFAFSRIGGRSTMVYPTILGIFALHTQWSFSQGLFSPGSLSLANGWYRCWFQPVLKLALVLLACTELAVFYNFQINLYQPYTFPPNFWRYMATVKAQPGEAVLDFPFCTIGGNGIGGLEGLCPYYTHNMVNFSLRRYHEKKVVGQYFGRLHPTQLTPLVNAGLPKLLLPDSETLFKATRQVRCFNAQEWQFFEDFYRLNDFAGINLYTNLLPPACVENFYQRLGRPIEETVVPLTGKVVFIPKSPQMQQQLDRQKGMMLKFGSQSNTP